MLELKNVFYNIDGKNILNNINLKFEKGRIYVITGPNGSGKSSIAKIIAGIIAQNSGTVEINGESIDLLDVITRARRYVAYSFQTPVTFKGITVSKLLDIAKQNSTTKMNKAELLFKIGLSPLDYMDRMVDETLSGGELKRIEIATALARDAKIIILDEPEAGIDLWSMEELLKTLKNMNKENKTTFIIISHQEKLFSLADQIIVLRNGIVVDSKSKEF